MLSFFSDLVKLAATSTIMVFAAVAHSHKLALELY